MNDYYEIGSRETVLGGVVFKSGQTDQGVVYKSERAFKEKQGICYIPECAFENEELLITVDTLPGLLLEWTLRHTTQFANRYEPALLMHMYSKMNLSKCALLS